MQQHNDRRQYIRFGVDEFKAAAADARQYLGNQFNEHSIMNHAYLFVSMQVVREFVPMYVFVAVQWAAV
jgi:hypothetical protein